MSKLHKMRACMWRTVTTATQKYVSISLYVGLSVFGRWWFSGRARPRLLKELHCTFYMLLLAGVSGWKSKTKWLNGRSISFGVSFLFFGIAVRRVNIGQHPKQKHLKWKRCRLRGVFFSHLFRIPRAVLPGQLAFEVFIRFLVGFALRVHRSMFRVCTVCDTQ